MDVMLRTSGLFSATYVLSLLAFAGVRLARKMF